MSHFAKVEDGVVTEVIVAEQDVIDSGLFGDPSLWIQTSYNTKLNSHRLVDNSDVSGGTPMRGNFAGVGYTYDSVNDIFMPPKPFDSWVVNSSTWRWIPPIPHPADGKNYRWDEDTTSWFEVEAITEEGPPPPGDPSTPSNSPGPSTPSV